MARSWGVHWGAFVPCILIGFFYGAIAEYVSFTPRVPDRFTNIPLYVLVSALAGLVMVAITFAWSVRTVLLFDGGLVFLFSQKTTTRVIGWHTVPAASVRALWTDHATIGRVVRPRTRSLFTSIGVKGRYGVLFSGADVAAQVPTGQAPAGQAQPDAPVVRTFLFAQRTDTAPLVHAMAALMRARGVPGAEAIGWTALPPTRVSTPIVVGE
ncbi:hypothetical protein SAMN05216410_0109 [Sanguibacter gelidistatuariae]|uniref:Uncharacterized protein n=1 Tax=Sanguibacter gelidistatuariae TaxID=1814289 RepID=A0A1G6X8A5_9MICO|nr:hypothetical protein SAMN05216410_0109 [Sanguibacter gelidistatuariae]